MKNFRNIDDEIQKAEENLAKLKAEKKKFEELTEAQKLAELIHESQCHYNHTDGCGWFYESWDNPGYSREEYLTKAENILKEVPYVQAVKMIKFM